jgi:hypothetical protein
MPKPPKTPAKETDPKARPGLMGLLVDRQELIAKAFNSYVKQAEQRRKKYNSVLNDDKAGEVKYETRKRGPADTEAKRAGKIEKLK